MAATSNAAAKPKPNRGAMAMAARTGTKAKAQAATGTASRKRARAENLAKEDEDKEKEETGKESSDNEDGFASTTSSKVSHFIDRRERLAALESELYIEIQTEKEMETRIVDQKQINTKKMKELTTARIDYPSEINEKVTLNFILLHNQWPDIRGLGYKSQNRRPKVHPEKFRLKKVPGPGIR